MTKKSKTQKFHIIKGKEDGRRLESRLLEEKIQRSLKDGHRNIEVEAYGQHGIGGRLWRAGDETVVIKITGSPGQRVGAMGFPNTHIEVMGPSSDDVGWLNTGAEITVHGNATNGVANAMAQGKIFVAGNIGARGMTMTKHNPKFAPPELWVLGSVGDYFAEFMAGGIAVICGFRPQDPENILGYRPCVGMVGGKIFFRGPHKGFSRHDAKPISISEDDWQWLIENLKVFLDHIGSPEILPKLSNREEWQLLIARTPQERTPQSRRSMQSFRKEVWDKELGKGGMIGDLLELDMSPIPVITNGDLRRFIPVWENKKYLAPCQANCPTGIPIQERWQLIREGRIDEAVDLALAYTPFPATVCGYLCPNPCMDACTRASAGIKAVDVTQLGQASAKAGSPEFPPLSGKQVAVIGGGPAGISLAWQLRLKGHNAVIYDMDKTLGGKIQSVIPNSRIPKSILEDELERVRKIIPHIHLQQRLEKDDIEQLKLDYDFVVIATGAQKPRELPVPGQEKMIPALDFLRQSKAGDIHVGSRVVIIGAGNVGCDAATEAHRLGAKDITLIDIQEPLSFGKERKAAEAIGAKFRWPCFTESVTDEGVRLTNGELIPADTVIISIGDAPDLSFLPDTVKSKNGFIEVNDIFQTTDPKIFAIGDVIGLGLLTDAIGAGRKTAMAIDAISAGKEPEKETRQVIDLSRVKVEYFDPRQEHMEGLEQCASGCASCGTCRDCEICITICPQSAISKLEKDSGEFELVVDAEKCIGCGFCAGVCPCGIWALIENEPMD